MADVNDKPFSNFKSVDMRLLALQGTRTQLLQFCQWNDLNGEFDTLSTEELREIVKAWADDEEGGQL